MLFKVEIMEFEKKKKNDYYIKYNFWSIHVEQPRQQIIVIEISLIHLISIDLFIRTVTET